MDEDGHFGAAVAARYDETSAAMFESSAVDPAVDLLAGLAGDGRALELGIGTGRIALPLAARGVPVDGIDISDAMVARLRDKPGGAAIAVTMGNFADVAVAGRYRLIYVVYNTLFNLLSQDEQVRCFENVAGHLADDGVFVVEAFVPTYLHRLRDDQYVDAEAVAVDSVWLDVGRHDPVAQRLDESHVHLTDAGVRVYPIVTRYAWPSELDLMARFAGLRLRERWGGWHRQAFTANSDNVISVYTR
jgi:SAM-dependent methyltransferase